MRSIGLVANLGLLLLFVCPFIKAGEATPQETIYVVPLEGERNSREAVKSQDKFLRKTNLKIAKLSKQGKIPWRLVQSRADAELTLSYRLEPLESCITYTAWRGEKMICAMGQAELRRASDNKLLWRTSQEDCTWATIFGTVEAKPWDCVGGLAQEAAQQMSLKETE